MLKLVIKDFAIQRGTLKRYLISALFISAVFWFTDMKQMSIAMAMFPILYGFINGTLYEDEKNNSLRLLASLPFSRENIVYARYLSIAIVTVASTVIFSLLGTIVFGNIIVKENFEINISVFVITLCLFFTLMISIYLPMAFKMGYIKASSINRFVMLGLFGVIGGMGATIGRLGRKGNPPAGLVRMMEALVNINPAIILGVCILFITIIYLVSMQLSVRFFKKRNLF